MSDELREAVARAIGDEAGYPHPEAWLNVADAALTAARPVIERETREACAKVADDWAADVKPKEGDTSLGVIGASISFTVAESIAAAIRSQP